MANPPCDTTVVLSPTPNGLPYISYWGTRLPNSTPLQIDAVFQKAQQPQQMGATLDIPEFPSLLPTQAEAWSSTPLISLSRNGRELFPHFHNPQIALNDEATEAVITANDLNLALNIEITIQVHPSGLVSQQIKLVNLGETTEVHRLWVTFPVPPSGNEILTHTGHHLRERTPLRTPLSDGFHAQESWTGRPDFHSGLLTVVGTRGFNWETGRCHATHVGWSGNVTHFITRTPYSSALIGGGELLHTGEITLETGESYQSPRVYASWGDGLNQLSQRFHQHLLTQHATFLTKPRPVTLNTWEAVYFNHDEQVMRQLAEAAARIGVERFVVDDGWFLGRRDDTRALGDWQVDPQMWPQGLTPLAQHVKSLGMEFGLWFEPEMISANSQVARTHPEWILQPGFGELPIEGRFQQVIDLSNPEVFDYIFHSISTLVSQCQIDYIKWDHNRFISEAISPYTGRPAVHSQTVALYALLDKLHATHPNLEIESCASGGGRVDLGILERTQRIWTSDCTDSLERVDIQAQTSLLVPPQMQGAHVADSPSHITRRYSTVDTRFAMTFLEHPGVEWNLLNVPQADLDALTAWISLYKQWRPTLTNACMVHAELADPALRLDGLVSTDQSKAVYRFSVLTTSARYPYDLVRLPGLSQCASYRVRPLGDLERLLKMSSPSTRTKVLPWWNESGAVLSGLALSEWGLRLPVLDPGSTVLFSVEQV